MRQGPAKRRQPRVDPSDPRVLVCAGVCWLLVGPMGSFQERRSWQFSPKPAPARQSRPRLASWGGFMGEAPVGPARARSLPSLSRRSRTHSRAASSANTFAVVAHFFSPRRGAILPLQPWHTQNPIPSAPVAWLRFPHFPPMADPASQHPSIPTPPDTTQDGTWRDSLAVLSLLPKAPNSQTRPDAPDPSPVSSLGPLHGSHADPLRLWPPWRRLCGRAASKCEMRSELACMGRE